LVAASRRYCEVALPLASPAGAALVLPPPLELLLAPLSDGRGEMVIVLPPDAAEPPAEDGPPRLVVDDEDPASRLKEPEGATDDAPPPPPEGSTRTTWPGERLTSAGKLESDWRAVVSGR
jgi:hypothetical protein